MDSAIVLIYLLCASNPIRYSSIDERFNCVELVAACVNNEQNSHWSKSTWKATRECFNKIEGKKK